MLCVCSQAQAQNAVPVFDPSNPLAGIPDLPAVPSPDAAADSGPIEALPPADMKGQSLPPVPDVTASADLPTPKDEDTFEFFQPGYQIKDDDNKDKEKAPEKPIEIKPKVANSGPRQLPLVRFNYKNQRLPYPLYAKKYDSQNHHLPIAMYESDYDAATFQAAMTNNVNGLRAMLNAGRNIAMRSPQGESLVQVATRYGAHDCLRLLLARGADGQGVRPPDQLAYYALRAAGAR